MRKGHVLVALIRAAMALLRRPVVADVCSDPMYEVGSFDGQANLADYHDRYLYGSS